MGLCSSYYAVSRYKIQLKSSRALMLAAFPLQPSAMGNRLSAHLVNLLHTTKIPTSMFNTYFGYHTVIGPSTAEFYRHFVCSLGSFHGIATILVAPLLDKGLKSKAERYRVSYILQHRKTPEYSIRIGIAELGLPTLPPD